MLLFRKSNGITQYPRLLAVICIKISHQREGGRRAGGGGGGGGDGGGRQGINTKSNNSCDFILKR